MLQNPVLLGQAGRVTYVTIMLHLILLLLLLFFIVVFYNIKIRKIFYSNSVKHNLHHMITDGDAVQKYLYERGPPHAISILLVLSSSGYPCYHSLVGKLLLIYFLGSYTVSFTHYLWISGLASFTTLDSTYGSSKSVKLIPSNTKRTSVLKNDIVSN